MINKISLLLIAVLTTSCGLNPQHADIDLQETLPEAKSTVFSRSLVDLGRANKIFGQGKLKVMVKNIVDNTGTSLPTEGEIPNDITEMLKSALNGVGGNIFYIPYDPTFMLNTADTGYTNWGNKELPDIVLSGGITEFDRALVTKGDNTDFGGELENSPFSLEFSDQTKNSIASITLDFNLIDFDTFTGIPHMQAINNIKVHKGLRNDSLGFTVYGATIGLRGTIKKIQGRHAATRLLVQLSLIQVLGRYQRLPYWKLLPGTEEDAAVIDLLTEDFYTLSPQDRIAKTQEYLVLMGKDVSVTGVLDSKTRTALNEVAGAAGNSGIDIKQFLTVYRQVPLDVNTLSRRVLADSMIANFRNGNVPAKNSANKPATISEVSEAIATKADHESASPVPESFTPVPESANPDPETLNPVPQSATPDPGTLNPVPKSVNPDPETLNPSPESLKPGSITLTTNQTEFNIGEPLVVSFTVDKPMYVRLITVNSEGKIANLFPNPYQSDNYAKPGHQHQIPPHNAKFFLKIRGPVGTDKIIAIAGVKPVTAEEIQLNPDGSFKIDPTTNNLVTTGLNIEVHKQIVAGN